MHVGRKESEIMRRGKKKNMQKGKGEVTEKSFKKWLIGVNKTKWHKADDGKSSEQSPRLNWRTISSKIIL